MNKLASLHDCERLRHCLVVTVLFVAAALGMRSESLASCGDYLIHNPLPHRTATETHAAMPREAGSGGPLDDSWFLSLSLGAGSTQLPEPDSACVSGRCHSLPLWPPVNHPSRTVVWKQSATMHAPSSWQSGLALFHWAFPADGSLPQQPLLAVEVPPPRLAH